MLTFGHNNLGVMLRHWRPLRQVQPKGRCSMIIWSSAAQRRGRRKTHGSSSPLRCVPNWIVKFYGKQSFYILNGFFKGTNHRCFHVVFFPCYHLFSILRPSSWRPIGRRHVCNENGIANLGFLPRFFHDGWNGSEMTRRFIWVPGSGEKQRDSKYHLGTEVFSERNPATNLGWLMVTYIIWTKNHTKRHLLWSEGPLYKLKVISARHWATDSEAWKFHFGFAIGSFN